MSLNVALKSSASDLYQSAFRGVLSDLSDLNSMPCLSDSSVSSPEILARSLVYEGRQIDMRQANKMLSDRFNTSVQRDFDFPPFYTDSRVMGSSWADRTLSPLEHGESWNVGRRASVTGVSYVVDQNGLPVNPFYNYGIGGRGIIGRYGPNHAVDVAPCAVMEGEDGESKLHVAGIFRRDTGKPALCGGFVDFVRDEDGEYPYPNDLVVYTQAREMFEEMISGSVPSDEDKTSETTFDDSQEILRRQREVHKKWEIVNKTDPWFIARLMTIIRKGHECFAGPVIGSVRNTNNAWMETRISVFDFDDEVWSFIRGNRPQFDYRLKAGDDALSTAWHEVSSGLVFDSGEHGAFFCYILAVKLLQFSEGRGVPDGVMKQARRLYDDLKQKREAGGLSCEI